MKKSVWIVTVCVIGMLSAFASASARSSAFGEKIFDLGHMVPLDSETKLSEGDIAPDFDLPAISGNRVRLSECRGSRHVMLTFVPAAWTPVCSDQWPGYHIARELFENLDTVVIGISCDNLPSQHAWILEMGGVWFDVVSDFWPHGKVSDAYGVLRSDGMSERAVFIIDKTGIIRFIHLEDINVRPDLGVLIQALEQLKP